MKTVELTLVFVVPDDQEQTEYWVTNAIFPLLNKDEQLVSYFSVEKPGDCRDD